MKELIIYILISIAAGNYEYNSHEKNEEIATTNYEQNFYEYEKEQVPIRQSLGALHWNEADEIFPRYETAKIVDVLTGKTFNVKRTFGRNHADVEPLTIEDTKIIRSLWGGDSWERRAIVVVIGDYKIAASMNGYAHAGLDRYPALATVNNRSGGFGRGTNLDMVKNNGADGHFCIHFYGSRTHGSGQINAEHQNAVREAAQFLD